MLKYTSLIILLIVLTVFACSKTEPIGKPNNLTTDIYFVKTLGGSLNERGESIIKTNDGGYAIFGYAQSIDGDISNKPDESFDYWLLKYNQNHELEWQQAYGGSDDDRGTNIIQTTEGAYALIGYSKSNNKDVTENNGANDFWFCKLDSSGKILWEKSFGFLGADNGNAIIQTQDGGFLITGVLDVSASNGQGNSKMSRAKLPSNASMWVMRFGI